jgi:hypothetical protein
VAAYVASKNSLSVLPILLGFRLCANFLSKCQVPPPVPSRFGVSGMNCSHRMGSDLSSNSRAAFAGGP